MAEKYLPLTKSLSDWVPRRDSPGDLLKNVGSPSPNSVDTSGDLGNRTGRIHRIMHCYAIAQA